MTITLRRAAHVCGIAAIALTLNACSDSDSNEPAAADGGGGATDEPTPESGDSGECDSLDELEISVPTHPPKFAQMTPVMASELGFYEEFCLDVTVTGYQTGGASLRALQAGEVPIGLPSSNAAIVAVGQGSPITIWGSPASRLPQLILATEEIESCADLEGQTVATEGPGGLVHFLMGTFLETCGLDIESDVEVFVGSPGDFGPQLAQGVAQASALHVDDEPLIEQTHSIELNVLESAAEMVPNFHYQIMVSQQEFLADEANRDQLVRFQAAILATNRWMADPANEEEMLDLATEITTRDRALMEYAYPLYVEQFPGTCADTLSAEQIDYTADLQVQAGELDEAPPFDELVDSSICADAEALLD